MSLNREFLIWKKMEGRDREREGVRGYEREREREVDRRVSGSAGSIFKVRFGREKDRERVETEI
jgi:hypothetical protein